MRIKIMTMMCSATVQEGHKGVIDVVSMTKQVIYQSCCQYPNPHPYPTGTNNYNGNIPFIIHYSQSFKQKYDFNISSRIINTSADNSQSSNQ